MKNSKHIWKGFTLWEADEEIAELNRQSEKGWQLIKGGIYDKLVRDDSAVYRYQIDYHEKPDERYYETFGEQGWQYVCKYNDFNYFRKPYDPSLPESEYEIYTDDESYRQSYKSLFRERILLAVLYAFVVSLNCINIFVKNMFSDAVNIFIGAAFMVCELMFIFIAVMVYKKMNNRDKKMGAMGKITKVGTFIALLMILATPWLIGIDNMHSDPLLCNMTWGASDPVTHELDINVERTGKFRLDLDYTCGNGTLDVKIVDDEGNELFVQEPTADCEIDDMPIRLKEGHYTMLVHVGEDEPSENVEFSAKIDR